MSFIGKLGFCHGIFPQEVVPSYHSEMFSSSPIEMFSSSPTEMFSGSPTEMFFGSPANIFSGSLTEIFSGSPNIWITCLEPKNICIFTLEVLKEKSKLTFVDV